MIDRYFLKGKEFPGKDIDKGSYLKSSKDTIIYIPFQ